MAVQINQPVGIAVQHGFNKFIYEATVVGFESSVNRTGTGRIVLEMPEKAEKMQRREYVRIDVPSDMTVKVLFWHRGYLDDTAEVPHENYWQGSSLATLILRPGRCSPTVKTHKRHPALRIIYL